MKGHASLIAGVISWALLNHAEDRTERHGESSGVRRVLGDFLLRIEAGDRERYHRKPLLVDAALERRSGGICNFQRTSVDWWTGPSHKNALRSEVEMWWL